MKLVCKNCKEKFDSDRSNKIYCSMNCYAKSKKGKEIIHLIGKRIGKPKNQKMAKCGVCSNVFSYWAGRKTAKYCSKDCWKIRNPKILNECLLCGKEFWSYKSDNKTYCSKKCSSIKSREFKKGNKSHLWKGGKTKLNKLERCRSEYREWRNKIFIRDKYTCQKCGIKSIKGLTVYLHSHHIKSFADYPESRFDINNGITLCKNCHLLEHSHKF